jgi:acyl carrier protein
MEKNMNEVQEKLAGIVLSVVPEALVDSEACFDMTFREIGVDSLESMNVLLSVQEQFGITVPDEAFNQLNTLNQVAEFIAANKG